MITFCIIYLLFCNECITFVLHFKINFMETKFLLPNAFKRIGWMLVILMFVPGLIFMFDTLEFKFLDFRVFAIYDSMFPGPGVVFGMTRNNISDEIVGILFLLGAVFVAFSREKQEDEFIARIRLDSLVWAVYVNYAILLFCFLFFYGFGFMTVMILNMFSVLIFFIARFYFILFKTKNFNQNEEQA